MAVKDPLKDLMERLQKSYPKINLPEPQANEIRAALRRIPPFVLENAWIAMEQGSKLPVPLQLGQNLSVMKQAIREVLFEKGRKDFLAKHPG